MKIADLPLDDRPREKAYALGIASLTDAELLALILGKGSPGHSALEIAYALLHDFGSLSSIAEIRMETLCAYPGVKQVKALRFEAVFEIAKRIRGKRGGQSAYRPDEIASVFAKEAGEVETLFLLSLDGMGKVKTQQRIGVGGDDLLLAKPKDILAKMIQSKYKRFVLVHTHPSGNALPSKEDLAFTSKLREESLSLGFRLVDHLVVADGNYYSFTENGLL
ncbi:MAG: DNA repair protein RadC [Bacilli bacterium]|nr:DNA repair protein RadC [Bacilli bacterium]